MLRGHSPLTYAIERGRSCKPRRERAGRRAGDEVARRSAGGRTGGRAFAPSSRRSDLPARRCGTAARSVRSMRFAGPWRPTATTFMSSRPASTDPVTATCRWGGRSISRASRSPTFPSRRLRRLYWSPPMRRALAASVGGFDRRASACRLSLADLGRRARRARARRALRHLAARHARARADPPQEPVGEGRLDRADRARQPRGGRRHPYDVVDRGGPSCRLRLEAAAGRHHPARRRRSATAVRPRRCRPTSPPRLRRARSCWRSAASAGRRASIG